MTATTGVFSVPSRRMRPKSSVQIGYVETMTSLGCAARYAAKRLRLTSSMPRMPALRSGVRRVLSV